MKHTLGNTLRVTATTALLAIGASEAVSTVAEARPNVTPASAQHNNVRESLTAKWKSLVARAEALAAKREAGAKIGTVAVNNNRVIFNDSSGGTSTEIQSDAYDSSSRTLEEYVIDVYRPAGQKRGSGMRPNNLFQISLFESRSNTSKPPQTTTQFNTAIATHPDNGAGYDFNLRETPDGDLEVTASHNRGPAVYYSTDVGAPLEHSIGWNFGFVNRLIAQASGVEYDALHQIALPKGQPAVLRPNAAHIAQ